MSYSINTFKKVMYFKNITEQGAAGRLAMLACGKKCILNLLFDKETGDPYVVVYTNDPDDFIKVIKEHELFKKFREDYIISVVNNRNYKEE